MGESGNLLDHTFNDTSPAGGGESTLERESLHLPSEADETGLIEKSLPVATMATSYRLLNRIGPVLLDPLIIGNVEGDRIGIGGFGSVPKSFDKVDCKVIISMGRVVGELVLYLLCCISFHSYAISSIRFSMQPWEKESCLFAEKVQAGIILRY